MKNMIMNNREMMKRIMAQAEGLQKLIRKQNVERERKEIEEQLKEAALFEICDPDDEATDIEVAADLLSDVSDILSEASDINERIAHLMVNAADLSLEISDLLEEASDLTSDAAELLSDSEYPY